MVHFDENHDDSSDEELQQEEVTPGRPNDKRIILHADVDCYEVQLWLKKNHPELVEQNIPIVVVNQDEIMLAVNYPARKLGVKRNPGRKALAEAKEICPNLVVITAGTKEKVVDTDTPLEECDKIINVFRRYQRSLTKPEHMIIEMSSRDEFYLDVTGLVTSRMRSPWRKEKAGGRFVKGYALPSKSDMDKLTQAKKAYPDERFSGNPTVIMDGRKATITRSTLHFRVREIYSKNQEDYHYDEARLIFGAIIAQTLMGLVESATGYKMSVGVAHNKLTAKVACSRNKPEGITILPDIAIERLVKSLKFQDLPKFKGIIGQQLREAYEEKKPRHNLVTLEDVRKADKNLLCDILLEIGAPKAESLYTELISRSDLRCDEVVCSRFYPDTVSQSMSFKWPHTVYTWEQFLERVGAISRLFEYKLNYRLTHHRRLTKQCSIKAALKSSAPSVGGDKNTMDMEQLPSAEAIAEFVINYMRANQIDFRDVTNLYLTGSNLEFCYN